MGRRLAKCALCGTILEQGEYWVNHVSPQEMGLTYDPAETDRIGFLRARMAMYPDRIGLRLRLAKLLEEQGQAREAEDLLRETAARARDNVRVRTELDDFLERRRLPERKPAAAPPVTAAPAIAPVAEPLPDAIRPETIPQARPEPSGAPVAALFSLPDLPLHAPPAADAWDGTITTRGHIPLPRARRVWPPPIELLASLGIVAVVATLGLVSRRLPHGLIMQAPANVTLPSAAAPSAPVSAVTALPAVTIPAAPPSRTLAMLQPALPALVVAAPTAPVPTAPLIADPPAVTPIAVTVLYAPGADRAKTADAVADRLRRDGISAGTLAMPGLHPFGASIGYYFDEDRPAAFAVANQLGTSFGPVHRLTRSKADLPAPGAVALVLP